MKKAIIIIFLLIILITGFYLIFCRPNNKPELQKFNTDSIKGTAIIITGAAGRIPQEAALLENLYRKGMLKDVVFISGASSGALNAVALNAILHRKYSWEKYKKLLFSLNNDSIFIQDEKKLPVNTDPLRRMIDRVFTHQLGFKILADLPVPTSISITSFDLNERGLKTYRLSNRKINLESDSLLNLADVLMASTAIPILFPPAVIAHSGTLPNDEFMDGGIAEDQIPIKALLDYQIYSGTEVKKIYIISRKSDVNCSFGDELKTLGLKDRKLLDRKGISPEYLASKNIIRKLKKFSEDYPGLAERTYVYIPDFSRNFPLIRFDSLQKQYEVTSAWAEKNQPVLLKDYLQGK